MSLVPRHGLNAAGAIPIAADIVDQSTLGSSDGLVVPDGDGPAILMVPCDAVGPADAPVIRDEVDPVIPDAVAPMSDGNPDDVAPKIKCEHDFKMQVLVVPVQGVPGDADQ